MHLDLGLTKTINRATHVTRGFRRIVMVTAAGEGRPDRLVTDLTNEFSRREIDVSQLPIEGSEDTASSMPAPAHKVLAKWSRHRQGAARHELGESLDHQCALIVTDPRRLDEIIGFQAQSDRPVVVLLATDPDDAPDKLPEIVDVVVTPNPQTDPWEHLGVPVHSIGVPATGGGPAPGDRPNRIALLGPCTDEQLADALLAFDHACHVVPGWSLEICLDDESRARSAVAAPRRRYSPSWIRKHGYEPERVGPSHDPQGGSGLPNPRRRWRRPARSRLRRHPCGS